MVSWGEDYSSKFIRIYNCICFKEMKYCYLFCGSAFLIPMSCVGNARDALLLV